jgi:NhaA family Na+:H+ antiporter
MLGLATAAGVGFTVALFVASLSFDTAAATDAAKVGILTGSTVSGVLGYLLLRTAPAAAGTGVRAAAGAAAGATAAAPDGPPVAVPNVV